MKSLYFLAAFTALVAAAPAPAPTPGFLDWIGGLFGGDEEQQVQRAARLRQNRATSAEIVFFSADAPRGQRYNVSVPATTELNVPEILSPTRMEIVRGPQGSQAICYVLDQYGRIDQTRFFSEGQNNAYVAPQGSAPRVGYISCAIQEPAVSEAILRFSAQGTNSPIYEDHRIAVPGAAEIDKPFLQNAQEVTMLAHPIPNTVCFLMDQVAGEPFIIGRVSIEGQRSFQSRNNGQNIEYISCLPPTERLEQQRTVQRRPVRPQ